MSTWAIVILVVWLLFMALIWKRMGVWSGRSYGNALAKYLGWSSGFFHTALDEGSGSSGLLLLNTLKQQGLSHHEATVRLSPYLARGLNALDARFGPQAMIEQARPTAESLLAQWTASQDGRSAS